MVLAWTVVATVLLILHLPILFVVPYAYWQRRHEDVIKHRRPRLVTATCIALALFSVQQICRILLADYIGVWFDCMFGICLLQISLEGLFLFTLSLYIAYNKTCHQLAIFAKTGSSSEDEIRSLRMQRLLLTDKFAAIWIVVNVSIGLLAILIYAFAVDISGLNTLIIEVDKGNWTLPSCVLITTIRALITVILYLLLSFKLRLVQDAFGSKQMLRRIGIASFFFAAVYQLTWNINFGQIAMALAADWAIFNLCILPMIKTRQPSAAKRRGSTYASDFVKFIETERGFAAFRSYLETEFSVENLLFWKETMDFKANFGKDHAQDRLRANAICNKYLTPLAPLEVNLPGSIIDSIQSKLRFGHNEITASMFDTAAVQIVQLMETDSLMRFTQTEPPIWQEFVMANTADQFLTDSSAKPMTTKIPTSIVAVSFNE